MKKILVYAHWKGINRPSLMGTLYSSITKGKEIFSFEYTEEWLSSGTTNLLDPELQLFPGKMFVRDNKPNFGVFLDSSPDRWGKLLMKRKEAILSRLEKREEKKLNESDFLLGVYDEHRLGGIRYKLNESDQFLSYENNYSVPPWTSLRELENAARKIESEIGSDKDNLKWLNILLAPGSSIGGARPKAGVMDPEGNLWIAKFPSKNDEYNTGAWEYIVNLIANKCGIKSIKSNAIVLSGKQHTFLSKRFDREKSGTRIHFASAMTLLGYSDGADYLDGVSYLEIAEFIMRFGCNVESDLEDLWKRIVLSICISNTDDHLRNHGFLMNDSGWSLSPVFDINPIPYGTELKLNITENDNSLNIELAMDTIDFYRIKLPKAKRIVKKISNEVSKWREHAKNLKIERGEIDSMSSAFNSEN